MDRFGRRKEDFDFTAQHYTGQDLANASHPTDLEKREEVFLRLMLHTQAWAPRDAALEHWRSISFLAERQASPLFLSRLHHESTLMNNVLVSNFSWLLELHS